MRFRLLRVIEYICWSAGTILLAYVGLSFWSSARFQQSETTHLKALQLAPVAQHPLHPGDLLGKISVPRLGVSAIVAEGVDDKTLRHAVGHFPESSFPDQGGNVALAGHRDTFFRGLANIRVNDTIIFETPGGNFKYEVIHTAVVGPQHTELVRSSSPADLTLVTCFPFHYIGSAPKRFIVQAVRIRPH